MTQGHVDRTSHWTRGTSRRRLLKGAAAGAAGSAGLALVGCGDDDDSKGESTPLFGSTPTPAAKETAKKGGTYVSANAGDIPTIDPYASVNASTKTFAAYVYSRLYQFTAAQPNELGAVPLITEPDAAAAAPEISSDGLKYTIKLKPNVKFHAPISRNMTADDVVFSWQRFTGKLPGSKPATNTDRLSMIDNVRAVDAQTVLFELNRKHGPFVELLADTTTLLIMPKETGTAFDPAQKMVGSGPWVLDTYQPGSIISFKRHAEWHGGPDRPYLDRLEFPTIKEQTNRLNQFLSGKLDTYGSSGLDVGDIKKQIPDVQYRLTASSGLVGMIAFSRVQEQRSNAPWTDVRVRRALSMAIDRDSILDVAYNVDKINQQGIKIPHAWEGIVAPGFGDLAVDPKSDPEIAKWFSYDPKGAKALLQEAGVGNGFSLEARSTPQYTILVPTIVELVIQYWKAIGVNATFVPEDYGSKWIPETFKGKFEGVAFAGQAGIPDAGALIQSAFSTTSDINQSKVNDPKVEKFVQDYGAELDRNKRKQLVLDIQKYLLPQMYYIPDQWGSIPGITLYQPQVRGLSDHLSFGYSGGQEMTYAWKA